MGDMLIVEFVDWEDYSNILATWELVQHWVPRGEQVWIGTVRYEVIRVEHVDKEKIICFVREIH